jgi:hypothetical protein
MKSFALHCVITLVWHSVINLSQRQMLYNEMKQVFNKFVFMILPLTVIQYVYKADYEHCDLLYVSPGV